MKSKFVFLLFFVLLFFYSPVSTQNLNWARMTQGIQADNTVGLTVDNVLNIYTVSNFTGNISLSSGQNFSSVGKEDFLVKKFSPNGVLQWARKFGGSQSDFANNISSDINNNIYITGTFQDTLRLFDQLLLISGVNGANVGFVLKLDPLGTILWAKALNTNQLSFPVKALVSPSRTGYGRWLF
ncbi:MAG: SBBP repeat-containing protein [Saprospiraceae bacterium]|nr:SBBP repeat-containing protein [Saprospiraceae bacterium]